jgi:plastocyanin
VSVRHTLFAIILAGAAAACGGGGSSYPTMSTGGSGSGGTPPPSTSTAANIFIQDFAFGPANVTIKVGGSVTWTNYGGSAHTSTADGGTWNSGQLSPGSSATGYGMGGGAGGTFTQTFTTAGTYPYHCSNHSSMTGSVTVTP